MNSRWLVALVVGLLFSCNANQTTNLGAKDGGGTDGGLLEAAVFDADFDAGVGMCPGQVQSFIWIANTGDGTLSKVCTHNAVEVARYVTSSVGAAGDPSRTSVNRHGDMVVTNRSPTTGPEGMKRPARATASSR